MQIDREILDEQIAGNMDDEMPLVSDKSQGNRRRKKLLAVFGLVVLLVLSILAGYFLLSGKEVNVIASRKAVAKITSGSDLQKAAYDSLSGSLNANPQVIGAGPRNVANATTAGASPSTESAADVPRILTPVEPGIAMTISPPPEALISKQAANNQQTIGARPEYGMNAASAANTSVSAAFAKPKTDGSILFASFPATNKSSAAKVIKTSAISLEKQTINDAGLILIRARTTPDFGAMLPVRLMGVLYTLRAGSLARLELTRDVKTDRWALKRGTVFVGALLGSDLDRAYVQIKGFIDPETNGFVKLEGELLGSDGGAGVRGKQRRISPVWVKILDRAAQAGTQILTSVLGRNSSVIVATDPYGTYRSASGVDQSQQNNRTFVEVPAGAVGFVLVTTLPEPARPDSHLAGSELIKDGNDLSDTDLANLLAEANAGRIREQLPRMNSELRRVAEMVLKEIEASDKQRNR